MTDISKLITKLRRPQEKLANLTLRDFEALASEAADALEKMQRTIEKLKKAGGKNAAAHD